MLAALQAKAKEREKDNGFSWVLENKLGGMRYPQKEDEFLKIVETFHIGLVVSLSEDPIRCVGSKFENIKVKIVHHPVSGIKI